MLFKIGFCKTMLHKQKALYLLIFSLLSWVFLPHHHPSSFPFLINKVLQHGGNKNIIWHTQDKMKNLPCFGLRSLICIKLDLYMDYIHIGNSTHAHQDFTLWKSNLNAHQIYLSFPFENNFTTTTTIVSLLFHNISLLC